MRLKIHCFASKAKITPQSFSLVFKGCDVVVSSYNHGEGDYLLLEVYKTLTPEEINGFKSKDEEGQNPVEFFEVRTRQYTELITEAAQLVEGLFSIFFFCAPPKFDSGRPTANLFGETEEEWELIRTDKVSRGFGYVQESRESPSYSLDESIKDAVESSSLHLPVFSFFAQAIRSLKDNEQELAFFLFFRIIEGYFSDGKADLSRAFSKEEKNIERYLPYDDETKKAISSILREMNLPSKCSIDYKGLLGDIVNIRHKLTHFSATNASIYHSAKIKFNLRPLNVIMYKGCFLLIREKVLKAMPKEMLGD